MREPARSSGIHGSHALSPLSFAPIARFRFGPIDCAAWQNVGTYFIPKPPLSRRKQADHWHISMPKRFQHRKRQDRLFRVPAMRTAYKRMLYGEKMTRKQLFSAFLA